MFLKKEKEPTTKLFDDDELTCPLAEVETVTADIPEGQVTYANPNGIAHDQSVDPQKVGSIQMGEVAPKYVSRPLLALSEGGVAALMTAMRQVGAGSQGGAEALAIFHQLIFDERITEHTLSTNPS